MFQEFHVDFLIFFSTGRAKLLRNYNAAAKSGTYFLAHSLTHGKIGVCFQTNFTVICSQFDQRAKLGLETMLAFDYELLEPAMYNLPQGGFLLMTTAEEEHSSKRMPKKIAVLPVESHVRRRQVTKIRADGRIFEKFNIDKYGCELIRYDVQPRFFQMDDGRYCLVSLCYGQDTYETGALDVVKTCFEEKNFVLLIPE